MFQNEKQLQEWLAQQLQQRDESCRLEVVTHNAAKTRADIVTRDAVIECKHVLTREKIHAAYGQSVMYKAHLNKSSIVLIGQPPFDQSEQQAAINAARALQTADRTLSIYWLTQAGLMPLGEARSSVLDSLSLPGRRSTVPSWKLIVSICWIVFGLLYGGSIGLWVGVVAGIWLILWR